MEKELEKQSLMEEDGVSVRDGETQTEIETGPSGRAAQWAPVLERLPVSVLAAPHRSRHTPPSEPGVIWGNRGEQRHEGHRVSQPACRLI